MADRRRVGSVVFVVGDFHTNMFPIVQALTAGGIDVHVICETPGRWHAASGIEPIVVDPRASTRSDLVALLDRTAPDVIVLRNLRGAFPRLARMAARRGARTVFYNQAPLRRENRPGEIAHDVTRYIGRRVLGLPRRRITPVVGPPDGTRTLNAHLLDFPMPVVPGAERRDYFTDDIATVVCVGKLDHPRKRQHWLLGAAERIETPFRIVLVSPGPRPLTNDRPTPEFPQGKATGYRQYYERVVERATSGPLADRVTLRIDVPYPKMLDIYRQADIFVLPSRDEPFAISPLEAMAAGTVPVISDANGAVAYITHDDGVIVPVDDFERFVSELDDLVSSRDRTRQLGRAAVAGVRERHDPADFPAAFLASVGS